MVKNCPLLLPLPRGMYGNFKLVWVEVNMCKKVTKFDKLQSFIIPLWLL